jgi:hypothetical protein
VENYFLGDEIVWDSWFMRGSMFEFLDGCEYGKGV